jgi:hypothetical protein
MGILSAVAVAAPAGVLNAFVGEKSSSAQMMGAGRLFVVFASILICSCGSLFLQTTVFACVILRADFRKRCSRRGTEGFCRSARTHPGGGLLAVLVALQLGNYTPVAAFSAYLLVFFFFLVPSHWPYLQNHLAGTKMLALSAILIADAIVAAVQPYAYGERGRLTTEEKESKRNISKVVVTRRKSFRFDSGVAGGGGCAWHFDAPVFHTLFSWESSCSS